MKLDRIVLGVILLGLISSGIVSLQRARVEMGYKNYEMTVDFDEMERFASETTTDVVDTLTGFKQAGIPSVNITEATINNLKHNMEYKITTQMRGYDLIITGDPEGLHFIEQGLKEVLKEERKMTYPAENILEIEGLPKDYISDTTLVRDIEGNKMGGMNFAESSKLEYVGLGYLDYQIQDAKKAQMKIALRPVYMEDLQDVQKSIDRFTKAMDSNQIKQDYVIFSGQEALAWDEEDVIAKTLHDRNIAVAMIESSVQREHLETKGMKEIAENMDYKAIRAFTTWQFIQRRFDYGIPGHHEGEEIVNTYYRAITERNIRLIYFKPFIQKNGGVVTDMTIYKNRLDDLAKRLESTHHIVPGDPKPMNPLRARRSLQMVSALGVIAAWFVLLDNILPVKRKLFYSFFAIGAAGTAGIYTLNLKLDLVNKMMGLLATIVFPTLAVVLILSLVKFIFHQSKRLKDSQIFIKGASILMMGIFISLAGTLYEVAFFANSKFLLELDIFKGVKLSQVAPLGLTLILFLCIFGYKRTTKENYLSMTEIRSFLGESIRIWQALVAVILLGVVGILLLRSGHETNVQPSSLELLMRNGFEYLLPARPRTKALILGYPSVIIFVYLAYHKRFSLLYPVLGLMVAIGQSNILNTFSHIRTPLYISLMRVGYEFLMALAVGGLAILIIKGFTHIIGKVQRNV